MATRLEHFGFNSQFILLSVRSSCRGTTTLTPRQPKRDQTITMTGVSSLSLSYAKVLSSSRIQVSTASLRIQISEGQIRKGLQLKAEG